MRDRHKIEFYVSANIPDGYGGTIPGESLYWSTFASVKPLKSSRDLESNQGVLTGGYEFLIRYRKDKAPSSSMVIHYKGRILTVSGVVNLKEENQYFRIVALDSGRTVPVIEEPVLDLTSVEKEQLKDEVIYEFVSVEDGQVIEL